MTEDTQTAPLFRFSLKALFGSVAVAAILFSWIGYHVKWKWERHEFLDNKNVRVMDEGSRQQAPGALRCFGEDGYPFLYITETSELEVQEANRLFPESRIIWAPKRPAP